MAIDPVSLIVEIAGGMAVERAAGPVRAWVARRSVRKELAKQLWDVLVADGTLGLHSDMGWFDPGELWAWLQQESVTDALASCRAADLVDHASSLAGTWRSSHLSMPSLSMVASQRAATLVYHLVLVHALSTDDLVRATATRLADEIDRLHNDVALVCQVLADAYSTAPTDRAANRLRLWTARSIAAAERGIRGDGTAILDRAAETRALNAAMAALRHRQVLLVDGAPDVGKSHLAMTMTSEWTDGDVVVLDARNLPPSFVEFEHLLECDLATLIAHDDEVGRAVFVVDGTERALVDRGDFLERVVTTAVDSGAAVVIVARSDAAPDLASVLQRAGLEVVSHEVKPLAPDDIVRLLAKVPELIPASGSQFGKWLLSHVGLVNAVLAAGDIDAIVSSRSEADVADFMIARRVRGSTAHGQRRLVAAKLAALAAVGVALGVPDGDTVDDLRRDGVLARPVASWSSAVVFDGDVWLDTVLAAAFAEEPELLKSVPNPRTVLRAARLACSLRLRGDPTQFSMLSAVFARLATITGEGRWAEIPYEAMLRINASPLMWQQAWSDNWDQNLDLGLRIFNRAVDAHRFAVPDAYASLVTALVENWPTDVTRSIAATHFVRRWLEAMAVASPAEPTPERANVVAHLVAHKPDDGRDHEYSDWLHDLALGCADLRQAEVDTLIEAAAQRPAGLDECFRSPFVFEGLVDSHPDLLLELSRRYYIDSSSWSMHAGIRQPYFGLSGPEAGPRFSPAPQLLRVRWQETLRLIDDVLEHGCKRSQQGHRFDLDCIPASEPGVVVEIPGRGPVHLFGDTSAWMWYRGTNAAPSSAVSLLMALESWADRLILEHGFTVDRVTSILLASTTNVAMVGLAVGIAVRHLDLTNPSETILTWYGQAAIWEFEIARVQAERLPIGRVDRTPRHAEDRRQRDWRGVGRHIAASARARGDDVTAGRLEVAADRLAGSTSGDRSFVRMWAAEIRPSLITIEQTDDGTVQANWSWPSEVLEIAQEFEEARFAEFGADDVCMRYSLAFEKELVPDELALHLEQFRSVAFAESEYVDDPTWRDAQAHVAAAVIRCVGVLDNSDVDHDGLLWAVEVLLRYAKAAPLATDEDASNGDGQAVEDPSVVRRGSSWSPSHCAASALFALLVAAPDSFLFSLLNGNEQRALASLRAFIDCRSEEITWHTFAKAQPQLPDSDDRPGSRDVVLAVIDHALSAATRMSEPIPAIWRDSDIDDATEVAENALEATRRSWTDPCLLLGPLVALSMPRVIRRNDARSRIAAALELHASCFKSERNNPYTRGDHFSRVGLALFNLAENDGLDLVVNYLGQLDPSHQAQTLRGLRQVAGDDPSKASRLAGFWPELVRQALGRVGHGDRFVDPCSELLPAPVTDAYSLKSGDAYELAAANWISTTEMEEALDEWLHAARGCGRCASALGAMSYAAPVKWAVTRAASEVKQCLEACPDTGLDRGSGAWLRDLVGRPGGLAAMRRSSDVRAVVDRLAAHGDHHATIVQTEMDDYK